MYKICFYVPAAQLQAVEAGELQAFSDRYYRQQQRGVFDV